MPSRTPPENDHDLSLALWHAVIGTNGAGLITQVQEIKSDIKDIIETRKHLVTKEMCLGTHAVPIAKRRSRWLMTKDIVLILTSLVGIISGAIGAGLALGLFHFSSG